MRIRFVLPGILLVFLLAACQQNSDPQALPTVQSLPTQAAPEATNTTADVVQPETQPTRNLQRPTLPPTWTPVPVETETPIPSPTEPLPTPFNPPATMPAGCSNFRVDFGNSTTQFPIGNAPTVRWIAAEGAIRYRLKLVEVSGDGSLLRTLNEDIYVAETSYTFPVEYFKAGIVYGWEVYPINDINDQMCFNVGDVLMPFKPLG